jgi:hypothetical protein
MNKLSVICEKCKAEMRVDKVGVPVQENARGAYYHLWSGDRLKCPACGMMVIARFGNPMTDRPLVENPETVIVEER